MPLSPEQRACVLANISSGRLRLDRPTKMYAGYGAGRTCDGCGEVIDRTMVEYEAVYESHHNGASAGEVLHLHLGCAGLVAVLTVHAQAYFLHTSSMTVSCAGM